MCSSYILDYYFSPVLSDKLFSKDQFGDRVKIENLVKFWHFVSLKGVKVLGFLAILCTVLPLVVTSMVTQVRKSTLGSSELYETSLVSSELCGTSLVSSVLFRFSRRG